MLEGFQKYVVEQGFKRSIWHFKKGISEDYDSYQVSTFGPTEYIFEREGLRFYWGLGVAGHAPYYFMPKEEHMKIVLSRDNEKDLNDIINGTIQKVLVT